MFEYFESITFITVKASGINNLKKGIHGCKIVTQIENKYLESKLIFEHLYPYMWQFHYFHRIYIKK